MPLPTWLRPCGLLLIGAILSMAGCAILPYAKYPNEAKEPESQDLVGTYNASLNVPWDYDFSGVSEWEAAKCRHQLASGITRPQSPDNRKPGPCDGIPRDPNFVALAISGGGSRSAALSAAIMWELERHGILKHVDVISAVSGGAQAAALYALMRDPADAAENQVLGSRYVLSSENFVDVFKGNLTRDWFLSLLMPWNLPAYAFTYYDRTDVMARTYAQNYYARSTWDPDDYGLRYREINAKRPNLLLNTVDMSLRVDEDGIPENVAGRCFPISYEAFRNRLASNLHDFPIAQAVMASNAFPGVYHFLTLKNFAATGATGRDVYVHLGDGGIRDHLALVPINAMLRRFAAGRSLINLSMSEIAEVCDFSRGARTRLPNAIYELQAAGDDVLPEWRTALPEKVLVIVVDAGIPPRGLEETEADPGANLLDRLFPVTKAVDAMNTALDDQRALRAVELIELRNHLTGKAALRGEVDDCVATLGERVEDLVRCLLEVQLANPGPDDGVLGFECCPMMGIGIHNFMKFATEKFGPINRRDLDSDKPWGADLVTLECQEDNDFGRGRPDSLYSQIRRMNLGLSLDSQQLTTLKRAAQALVAEALVDLCDTKGRLGGIDAIACSPPPTSYEVTCR